jgi:hypothetical protein
VFFEGKAGIAVIMRQQAAESSRHAGGYRGRSELADARCQMMEVESGQTRDVEHGRGDSAERITIEGLGFVEIDQVCRGHLP